MNYERLGSDVALSGDGQTMAVCNEWVVKMFGKNGTAWDMFQEISIGG